VYALPTPARTTSDTTRPDEADRPERRPDLPRPDIRTPATLADSISHDRAEPDLAPARPADQRRRILQHRAGRRDQGQTQLVPFDEGNGLYTGEGGHRSAPRPDGGAR